MLTICLFSLLTFMHPLTPGLCHDCRHQERQPEAPRQQAKPRRAGEVRWLSVLAVTRPNSAAYLAQAVTETLNRLPAVQAFLYGLLQQEEESAALRALAVLTELHRRNVWRDARTVNVIGECCADNTAASIESLVLSAASHAVSALSSCTHGVVRHSSIKQMRRCLASFTSWHL